jgi:hypothetical protein
MEPIVMNIEDTFSDIVLLGGLVFGTFHSIPILQRLKNYEHRNRHKYDHLSMHAYLGSVLIPGIFCNLINFILTNST